MEEYVLKALSLGFGALGFSCHAPCNIKSDWHMKHEDFPAYLAEIQRLRSLYRDRIEIYAGLEFDYDETSKTLFGSEYLPLVNYSIASVHLMYHTNTGTFLSVDGPVEEFQTLLEDNFHGDAQAMVSYYFHLEEQLIQHCTFDILGHCDLIKKRNTDNRWFDPQNQWYKEAALHMLHTARKHHARIEVNTGGIARGAISETYPSVDLIRSCTELGIPLILSSDAHASTHLDCCFSQTTDLLVQAGCKTLDTLYHGLWQTVPVR